jgi:hypothetical protein
MNLEMIIIQNTLYTKKMNTKTKSKILWVSSQILRYTVLAFILTLTGVITAGIGTLILLFFAKTILKLIPFNISLYKDLPKYENEEISKSVFIKKFKRKRLLSYLIYGIIPLILTIPVCASIIFLFFESKNLGETIFFGILTLLMWFMLILNHKYYQEINKQYNLNILLLHKYIWLKIKSILNNSGKNLSYLQLKQKNSESNFDENSNNKFLKLSNHSKSLNEKETIIIAIIIGAITFGLMSYIFGSESYYYKDIRINQKEGSTFIEFELNYMFGIIGFIVSSGLIYLLLSKKEKNKHVH